MCRKQSGKLLRMTRQRPSVIPMNCHRQYNGFALELKARGSNAPAGRTGGRFVWYSASMVLTFRTAMLSEGEEVGRVIRAAFTPYVRALGREFPSTGSARW